MDSTRKTLKENIKKYRYALKRGGIDYCKSADKFALFVGIEANTYKKYESTSTDIVPPYENLIKIAKALCISIDVLFNYVPPDNSIIETLYFLIDLGIPYKTDVNGNIVLSSPDNSIQGLQTDYVDLAEIIESYGFLDLDGKSKFIRQFIFLKLAEEWNNRNIDATEKAEHRLELIEKEIKIREEIKKATEKSYYYGFAEFRGGKK